MSPVIASNTEKWIFNAKNSCNLSPIRLATHLHLRDIQNRRFPQTKEKNTNEQNHRYNAHVAT